MLVFLVNPNAGGECGYRVFKKFRRRLLRTKTEYQVYVTGGIGEAKQLATELTEVSDNKELTLVAVGGGDTLNEVLDGARLSERLRSGFIPVGRGSDSVRGLKLPITPLGHLERILAPRKERSLDYGVVESGGNEPLYHRFPVNCGIGLDAEQPSGLYAFKQRHRRYSRLLWLGTRRREGLHALLRTRCARGYFETDSGQRVEFGHFLLSNAQSQPTEAGGIRFANQVPLSDGQLAVSVLNTQSRLQQARLPLLPRRLQSEAYAGVRVYRCQELHLCLDEALLFHTDGEGHGSGQEFTVRCVHRQIRLLC